MSVWIRRSFDKYDQLDVLSTLSEIYPSGLNQVRIIRVQDRKAIETACIGPRNVANDIRLFELFISAKYEDGKPCIFPIDHSYVAMFRRYPKRKSERSLKIRNNPRMITQIINQVHETYPTVEEVLESIEKPATSSRQLGQAFNTWCENTFPCIHHDIDEWSKCSQPISLFCSGEDRKGIDWARSNLNIVISNTVEQATGLDLMCKITRSDNSIAYILGEAKFLSDLGGTQKNQRDAAWGLAIDRNLGGELAGKRDPNWNPDDYDVRLLAILDGVCWIESNNNKFTKPLKQLLDRGLEDNLAISALLLSDYFDNVLNE